MPNSILLERVIDPAVRNAGEPFLPISIDSTVEADRAGETAENAHVLDDEKVSGEFAI